MLEWLVSKISLRLLKISSAGTMSAAASSGRVSFRMRPFDRAMVSCCFIGLFAHSARYATNPRTQQLKFFFDAFITAVNMVNAVNFGFPFGHQRSDHQTGRSAQVGCHDRRPLQLLDTFNDRGIAFDRDVR